MWTTQRIRQAFLEFFQDKGHELVPSSPLVPQNDPTLLFVNAGMVPFKDVFVGLEGRSYSTATSAQKCIRAGGKHNDLENVGYTARHHTFFEMMGNFSFGDYFKKDAITYAWTFLTEVLEIPSEKLYVTVYHTDDEAFDIWKDLTGFPDEKIIRISTHDNFWTMGDTGPCGPCSEIFYDHGPEIEGGLPGTLEEDGDRYVEIWNLVFMQYNQKDDGTREDLPKPSIDTGAGLERLAAVMQGQYNNYETDVFQNIIATSKSLLSDNSDETQDDLVSHRVIADHLRSSCFLIADGVLPSNEGRGYVLRRIMRRAMRHAYILGANEPLMFKLVPTLIDDMSQAYPELSRAQALITDTLKTEEDRFRKTLGRGLSLLDEASASIKEGDELAGDIAFKLYDTYGFPVDLTEDILRSRGLGVDTNGFEAAMEAQKQEARKSWSGSGESKDEAIWFDLAKDLPDTEFLGYQTHQARCQVQAVIKDGNFIDKFSMDDDEDPQELWIVLNQTPFYAESGGQVGDTGRLVAAGFTGYVTDCVKKAGKLYAHRVMMQSGGICVGETLEAQVNEKKRAQTRANHSATHILHATLRDYLGEQVAQKGSLVDPDRLRFDFSYNGSLSPQQIQAIEDEVNRIIRLNSATETKIMIPEDALKTGAVALFGEKYGDEVRVVAMGSAKTMDQSHYSIEFCGGTHVARTGDIGYFKIVSESGVAAGIRRIEAVTGVGAEAYARTFEHATIASADLLKTKPSQLQDRVKALISEKKALEKDIKRLKEKLALGGNSGSSGNSAEADVTKIGHVNYLAKTLEDASPRDLKPTVDAFKNQMQSAVIVIGANTDGKGSLVVGITDDLKDTINAVDLVRLGSEAIGGKGGGGRPDMAQAGGPNGQDLDKAYEVIASALKT